MVFHRAAIISAVLTAAIDDTNSTRRLARHGALAPVSANTTIDHCASRSFSRLA